MKKTLGQNSKQLISNVFTWFSYIIKSFTKPPILVIELTSVCNADCIMCYKRDSSRNKEHMDFSLFKKIVDDAQKSNIDTFQLSFYGESLMYPNFIEAILYIREKIPHAFITTNTNGLLLTPTLTKKLLDAKIDSIVISIEGNNKQEYESIRVNLEWDKLRENIKNMRKIINENNYPTKIGIMGLHLNDCVIDEKLYNDTWGRYCDTIFVRNDRESNSMTREPLIHQLLPCKKLFSQMVILTSGDVTRCDYDWEGEAIFANIKNSTILQLWKSSTLKKIRIKHLLGMKKKLDLCSTCSYRVNDPFKKSNLL